VAMPQTSEFVNLATDDELFLSWSAAQTLGFLVEPENRDSAVGA